MIVIGNGESRLPIDISTLKEMKIGCNAIIRENFVEHLVCVDRRMVQEALDLKTQAVIYTRKDWFNTFAFPIMPLPNLPYKGDNRPDEPMQWGSGPYAVLLGAMLSQNVKLIGFDLYSKSKSVNNIYKDTKNYDASDKRPVDPKYWIYQIAKVFEYFPETKFTVYNESDWIMPKVWNNKNVSLDTINNLIYNK